MSEAITTLMTVEEFLAWPGEGDTRYQLRDGTPVAMAPPSDAHQILAGNMAGLLFRAIEGRPGCTLRVEAGLPSLSRARNYHQADLAVHCGPFGAAQSGVDDDVLVVELLSPGTADDDRRIKLPDYRALPNVREILLLDTRHLSGEIHLRLDGDRWLVELLRDSEARLTLVSVGLDLPLAAVYRNVPLES